MGAVNFDLNTSQGVPVPSLSQSGLHGTPFGGLQPTSASNSQNFLGSSTVLTFSYGGINNANLRRGDSLLDGLGGVVTTPSDVAMDSETTGQYSDEMDADEEAPGTCLFMCRHRVQISLMENNCRGNSPRN